MPFILVSIVIQTAVDSICTAAVHPSALQPSVIYSNKQLLQLKSQNGCTTTTGKHEAAGAVYLPPASFVYSFSRPEHTGWNRNEVPANERVLPQPPPQPLISGSCSCAAVVRQIWRDYAQSYARRTAGKSLSACLPPGRSPARVALHSFLAARHGKLLKSCAMKLRRCCRSVCLIVSFRRVLSKLLVSHQFYLLYPQQRFICF